MPDVFTKEQPQQESPSVSNTPEAVKPVINSLDTLKKGKISYLTTYCELPEGVIYEGEDADEVALLFLRRDFITNIPWIVTTLVALILPLFLGQLTITNSIPPRFWIIIIAFYYVFIIGYAIYSFINWFYNISLITERDVVDVDYSHITYKNIAVATYEAIQDVEYIQSGFLRNFFDFGDVFVQTAGHRANIEFLRVPKPGKVADIINDQKKKRLNGRTHS